MRLFTWLCSLPIFAVALTFALQNRAPVTLSFWPLDAQATVPLSVLSLGLFVFGFLGGAFITSLFHIGPYFERRRLRKEVATLNTTIETQQKKIDDTPTCGPTILSQGRYQRVTIPEDEPKKTKGWFGRKQ